MKNNSANLALMNLNDLAIELHQAQIDQGFYTEGQQINIDQKLMLIVSEVSEAHEELRSDGNPHYVYYREDGKPEGFSMELADVFIRLLDLSAALGIRLDLAVAEKHAFNQTRPLKHGRLY
jgi:NTP pyrophosphatase (non-canonical NTP hydrolase)